jgi:hypothetical protein
MVAKGNLRQEEPYRLSSKPPECVGTHSSFGAFVCRVLVWQIGMATIKPSEARG